MKEVDEILKVIQPVIDGETDDMKEVIEVMTKVKRFAEVLKRSTSAEPKSKKRKTPTFASDLWAWKKEYAVSCEQSLAKLLSEERIKFSMHTVDWWKCALVAIDSAHSAGKHVFFYENALSDGAIYSGVSQVSIVKDSDVERTRGKEQQKPNRNYFFFHANDSDEEVERKLTNLANCIMPAKCKHYDLQILQFIVPSKNKK